MTLKKTIWMAALCTGFIATVSFSTMAAPVQNDTLVAAAELQGDTPIEKGPHVLPPF